MREARRGAISIIPEPKLALEIPTSHAVILSSLTSKRSSFLPFSSSEFGSR